MAGSYPDVPWRRMAWDSDGTVVPYWTGFVGPLGTWTSWANGPYYFSDAQKKELNDEDTVTVFSEGGPAGVYYFVGFIFPEKRDIYGLYTYCWSAEWGELTQSVETHSASSNALDPTGWETIWDDFGGGTGSLYNVQFGHRLEIQTPPETVLAARSLRMWFSIGTNLNKSNGCAIHIYGEINAAYTPDRMLYIDATTGLEYTAPIDWGDIPRGAVYDEDFWIKNNSSTLTAVNTDLSFEALYGNSDTFYTLSTGSGWSTGLGPVASIAAGARWPASNSLTVRCDPPSTADLGLHDARIVMFTSSWT